MRSREQFEAAINDFPVKTGRRTFFESLEKKQAFFQLLTDYYRLYMCPGKPLEKYELPLMETAIVCMRYYDSTKGDFLHLFNGEMKKAVRRAEAKERCDRIRRGLKLSRDDERLIQKIITFAAKRGLDIYDTANQQFIAAALHLRLKDVEDAVFINNDAVGIANTVEYDNGETADLFDSLPDGSQPIADISEAADAFRALTARIDRVFLSLRDSQKRLISMLVTAKVINEFGALITQEVLQDKAVFSREVYTYYCDHDDLPTQNQIGKMCGVPEQSVSRTLKIFKEKLKATL